jgi:hypothetical protein
MYIFGDNRIKCYANRPCLQSGYVSWTRMKLFAFTQVKNIFFIYYMNIVIMVTVTLCYYVKNSKLTSQLQIIDRFNLFFVIVPNRDNREDHIVCWV